MSPLPDVPSLYRRAEQLGRLWQVPNFARRVDIDFSWTMRSRAGYADLVNHKVRLNARLMEAHPDQLDDTLVHELAHVAAVLICGLEIRPHGPEWEQLVRLAGYEPTRTHTMDVSDLTGARPKYLYLHKCEGCGAFRLSRRVVRSWRCAQCSPGELTVWRAPDNPNGRRKLSQLAAKAAAKVASKSSRRVH